MTDAEARDEIETVLPHATDSVCITPEAARHYLVALADRAALCDTVPLEYAEQPMAFAAVQAARRHMRGEE